MASAAKSSKTATKTKKKAKRAISSGVVYVQATFNNTLITVTDLQGNVLTWATAGGMGYKGARKSTPFAAQQAAKQAAQVAKDVYSLKTVDVFIKGPGSGREAAARALAEFFKVTSISDITGIPHNGCRPEKERRV